MKLTLGRQISSGVGETIKQTPCTWHSCSVPWMIPVTGMWPWRIIELLQETFGHCEVGGFHTMVALVLPNVSSLSLHQIYKAERTPTGKGSPALLSEDLQSWHLPQQHSQLYPLKVFFFFWWDWCFELRASYLQSRYSTAWSTPPVHFAQGILEMESHELFAQAGLKPQSSKSQPPK
jgi:hypothetical protein